MKKVRGPALGKQLQDLCWFNLKQHEVIGYRRELMDFKSLKRRGFMVSQMGYSSPSWPRTTVNNFCFPWQEVEHFEFIGGSNMRIKLLWWGFFHGERQTSWNPSSWPLDLVTGLHRRSYKELLAMIPLFSIKEAHKALEPSSWKVFHV